MYVNYRSAASFLKPLCSDSNTLCYQILSKNHLPDALRVAHCLLSTMHMSTGGPHRACCSTKGGRGKGAAVVRGISR